MKDILWVDGLCDKILEKVVYWIQNYNKGTVCATKKFMNPPSASGVQIVDKPTATAVDVPWTQNELAYLVQVLEAKKADWPITKGLRKDLPKWKNGKLKVGGERVLTMAMFPESLLTIYELLMEMKGAQNQKGIPQDFDLSSVL